MKSRNVRHLKERRIIRAVVDPDDLPAAEREHLGRCPDCLAVKARLQSSLERLGREAELFSPAPGRDFSLPAVRPKKEFPFSWNMRFALGVVSLLILIWAAGISGYLDRGGGRKTDMVLEDASRDTALMSEISRLSENALPPEYMVMTGVTEEEPDEESRFLEFMIPLDEEEGYSNNFQTKGGTYHG